MINDISNSTHIGNPTSAQPNTRKVVYAVSERNDKSWWTKIGVAYVNKDGSLSVRLDAVPVNGTMQIRDEDPSNRRGGDGQ